MHDTHCRDAGHRRGRGPGGMPGRTVIDVGAGTAGCPVAFTVAPGDTIVAIDSNIAYLKKYRLPPGYGSAFQVVAMAEQLPIRGERADGVVCTELLEHVSDHRKVLAELSRVGKPGCGYYISVPVARWEHFFRALHPRWLGNSGHRNIFEIGRLIETLKANNIQLTEYRGANSWSCLYWFCHALARSEFNDAGLTLNHRRIDTLFELAEQLLRRLRLWRLFNAIGDRLLPKSWVLHAAKS
ncbi:MAG TPA: class I SAM-dependent methyltransferase [Candidatus Edwardsbacteria bacterium]|nr:class I SAM-dependent methyltransferase [Candidatus Edwardsbacteria bacterium]